MTPKLTLRNNSNWFRSLPQLHNSQENELQRGRRGIPASSREVLGQRSPDVLAAGQDVTTVDASRVPWVASNTSYTPM